MKLLKLNFVIIIYIMEKITNSNIHKLINKYFEGNSGFPKLNEWDVSNVTNMNGLFDNQLVNEPLDKWDVSNVTDMSNLFKDATIKSKKNQEILKINNWDVSNVRYMSYMFYNTSFNEPLNEWNVSKVIDMSYMFYDCSMFNQPFQKPL